MKRDCLIQSFGEVFNQNFQNSDTNVIQLKPENLLFEKENPKQKEKPNSKENKKTITVSTEKYSRPLKAVYPIINSDAFALTMDRYRVFVAKVNEFPKAENKFTREWNKKAKQFEPDELQKPFLEVFQKNYSSLEPKEYNLKVMELYNERKIIAKRKMLTEINYQSELVFQQFLYEYKLQLQENTGFYEKLNYSIKSPIKKLEINSFKVVVNQRNGFNAIDVCKNTIKNHRARLIEFGVLVDYSFHGTKRGVKVHINPEILAIFDKKTSEILITENQQVTNYINQDLNYYKSVNVTVLKENQIKENVDNNSHQKGTPAAEPLSSYNNTNPQDAQFQTGGGGKYVKLSENLKATIENEVDLAKNLSSGTYNYYKPIDIRTLHEESMYGILSREEFKEVILQDFFKSAAKLYRNSTPFVGSWLLAYRNWTERRFLVNGHVTHKDNMVKFLQELRWRLNHAHRWFTKHNEVKILFPNDYFDFTRKTAKELGFEYTIKAFKKHLDYLNQREINVNQRNINANQRKINVNHAKKFDLAFNKFKKRKISTNEMLDYIKNNLPSQYQMKFVERLKEYSSK